MPVQPVEFHPVGSEKQGEKISGVLTEARTHGGWAVEVKLISKILLILSKK
jgi:hypothetical protein